MIVVDKEAEQNVFKWCVCFDDKKVNEAGDDSRWEMYEKWNMRQMCVWNERHEENFSERRRIVCFEYNKFLEKENKE